MCSKRILRKSLNCRQSKGLVAPSRLMNCILGWPLGRRGVERLDSLNHKLN